MAGLNDFEIGDLVAYKSEKLGILRTGMSWYAHAVVASLKPFILVSEDGDMLWQATVKSNSFKKVGEADKEAIVNVLKRMTREHAKNEKQLLS